MDCFSVYFSESVTVSNERRRRRRRRMSNDANESKQCVSFCAFTLFSVSLSFFFSSFDDEGNDWIENGSNDLEQENT